MIYMIYAPSERPNIEYLVSKLSEDFEVGMAPLGLLAGSDEWKKIVDADIKKAHAAIVVVTDNAVQDETVAWRFRQADIRGDLPIFPVLVGESRMPRSDDIHPDLHSLLFRNAMMIRVENREQDIERLKSALSEVMPPRKKTAQCFLSYSRQNADFVARIANDLRSAGAKTWRDSENIPAGANWDREIEKAIRDCTHVIFVATLSSVESENVQDEIGLAVNEGKTVIPVMLETCKLPLRVHRAQWVDFRGEYESALQKLVEQLGLPGIDKNGRVS